MKRNNSDHGADAVLRAVRASARHLRGLTRLRPRIAVILGSGLGDFAETADIVASAETSGIPSYPLATVEGHRGRVLFARVARVPLLLFQGRVHFYETGILDSILHPVRVANELGITILVVTNAAGGIDPTFSPGDLMVIDDQINLTFEAPWSAARRATKRPYDASLGKLLDDTARKLGTPLRHGIYCGVKGPCYETAAEIEMVRRSGASAVGMSTVNEVSLAAQLGMRVAGISCITNLATGITGERLSHQEVTAAGDRVRGVFRTLLSSFVAALPADAGP